MKPAAQKTAWKGNKKPARPMFQPTHHRTSNYADLIQKMSGRGAVQFLKRDGLNQVRAKRVLSSVFGERKARELIDAHF